MVQTRGTRARRTPIRFEEQFDAQFLANHFGTRGERHSYLRNRNKPRKVPLKTAPVKPKKPLKKAKATPPAEKKKTLQRPPVASRTGSRSPQALSRQDSTTSAEESPQTSEETVHRTNRIRSVGHCSDLSCKVGTEFNVFWGGDLLFALVDGKRVRIPLEHIRPQGACWAFVKPQPKKK
eukprot:TRINITY_DN12114_c0_g1_i1.p1 TRINITY_DN12114_c0_g1~~TRINITY_DN12114_c0_g1_i1.p1  ORF type:complete len:190 (-),score=16.17 TRINITY_DN12114_c0_g1_i1:2-538(-)